MARLEIMSVFYDREKDMIEIKVVDNEEVRIYLAEISAEDVMESRMLTEVTP